jgi:mutator protein MutT
LQASKCTIPPEYEGVVNVAGIIPIAVCSLLKDGKILFIKRERFPFEGLLSLPGGKIEYGETLEEAAVRELEEETGIRSRFVSHLATIPEHVVENGQVIAHFMIQLCELEHLEELTSREFEPIWVGLQEIESKKNEITPSDFNMIKSVIVPKSNQSLDSRSEKTGSGYVQREFREI